MPLPVTGYSAKRLADWRDDLRSDFRAALNADTPGLGDAVNLDEGSVLGNLLDTVAARLDELAEASQDLFDSFDERNATGVYLENLARLVGITGRTPATYSSVTLTLTATAACTVPTGSLVADATGQQWRTLADVVFPGAGVDTVAAQPTETGPITAPAGTLTTIVTPVTGWSAVTNAADATAGTDRETDSDLRSRRRLSLQIAGASSPDAIRARVLDVDGITACVVFDNKTGYTVTVGTTTVLTLPPYTIGVVVSPNGLAAAVETAVAEAIWASAPAGHSTERLGVLDVGAGGGVIEFITDSSGTTQIVQFSTAVDRPITFTVTVVDGDVPELDATIEAVFSDYIDTLSVGEQPIALPIYAGLAALAGVTNVTALAIIGTVDTIERAVYGGAVITHI
jgi:uncharacterized phage protein gp47/JayE